MLSQSMDCQQQASGVSRREFLQSGGLGIGGLSVVGLGLPQLLQARAPSNGLRPRGSEKSCIFIMQYGGPSQIDTLDLKPHAADQVRGLYKPIATRVPGIQVCELLPRLARLSDRYCLVRSMTHKDNAHDSAVHVCMTGHTKPRMETPYFGSAMARLKPATRNVPSYLWLLSFTSTDVDARWQTGGFLGASCAPMVVGKDIDNPSAPGFRVKAFDPPRDVSPERLLQRRDLLGRLEPASGPLLNRAQPANLRRFQERAVDMVTGPEARRAFDLEQEPAALRERYGRHPLGQNLLMSRRLIESGVRLVTVHAWTGVPPEHKFDKAQIWDMHGGTRVGSIFGSTQYGLGWALPCLDQSLSALLEDLEVRGLLENTLVVLVGEFGREPRLTSVHGSPGREHWPACYSALLAGGGIRGGRVWGTSDKNAAYVKDSPVSPEDFGATLFHALGVPPETRLGLDGFTHPASEGKPILELFS